MAADPGTGGITAFLEARIREDEAAARAATPGPWEFEGDDPADDELFSVHDGEHGDLAGQPVAYTRHRQVANGQHIARHDPSRTLRETAAKRELIAFAFRNAEAIDGEWGGGATADEIAAQVAAGDFTGYGASAAMAVLAPLASVYAGHEAYNPAWSPSPATTGSGPA